LSDFYNDENGELVVYYIDNDEPKLATVNQFATQDGQLAVNGEWIGEYVILGQRVESEEEEMEE
jgi:hypothetical protein